MKRLFYSIFLLVILCPVKLRAQEGQPLDMLIASTADALVDWLFSLPRYNDVESGRLYDTAVYFLKDYRFSNSIVKYMTHKPNMIYTQKNGSAWIYSYQECSEQKWHLTKKVRLPKEMTLNILDGPFIKFYHDTISIHIRSSYLGWGKYRNGKWHGKGWTIGVSDWVSCKYIYSKTEERWVMVESDFGGI